MTDWSKIKRKRESMPQFVRAVLLDSGMMTAYKNRPAYQQNDYLAWIKHAKRYETQYKRLEQMIAELKKGDVYMKMKWGR